MKLDSVNRASHTSISSLFLLLLFIIRPSLFLLLPILSRCCLPHSRPVSKLISGICSHTGGSCRSYMLPSRTNRQVLIIAVSHFNGLNLFVIRGCCSSLIKIFLGRHRLKYGHLKALILFFVNLINVDTCHLFNLFNQALFHGF